jgi:hypothetical protein
MVLRHHILVYLNILLGVYLELYLVFTVDIYLATELFKSVNIVLHVITSPGFPTVVIVLLFDLAVGLHKVRVCLISVHLHLTLQIVLLSVWDNLFNIMSGSIIIPSNRNTTKLLLL